ncbi:uncharacterized protein LOC128870209 [Anastrepha ludens]|uniref:uncharacterized protein LOC128870209 n=1 Tax=Anastrepha ludens TaxID=28586 RepID=UPI0023B1CB9A|nr:uncharacterized protein LOC128870209 [Anastrepha ludens]
MAGWYRRFIDNFAAITNPITNLLKKGKHFSWNEEAQKSFDQLKQMLCSAPVLASPNYEKPFTIQCDASKLGVGAVLSKNNDDDVEVPIAYFSQKLSKAQSNHSVTELECPAAILNLKKFRANVEGQDFTITTDHASLQWLMRQIDLSSRLARWSLKLQGCGFKIEHRKGSLNVVPDSLSLQNFDEINELEVHPLVDLNSSDFLADEYKNLINNIRNNESRLPDLQIVDGHVYKRTEHPDGKPAREAFNWKLWIPKTLVWQATEHAHCPPNKCHEGMAKTLERLRLNLYWPNMTVDVKEFVGQCDICQQSKAPNVTLRPPIAVPNVIAANSHNTGARTRARAFQSDNPIRDLELPAVERNEEHDSDGEASLPVPNTQDGNTSSNEEDNRTPALEIGIFPTTYSYYNTILDAELPLVQASRRTIINKIIGPDNYIHFLQPSEEANPAHETNTYYSKLRFTNKLHNGGDERIVTTTNMLTQVIVTESLPSRSTTLLTIRKEPLEANSSLNITKTVQAWSLKSTPNSLNTEYDVHIYTTKTFITTFTYFKTSLLSASDDEDFTTTHSISLPKNLTITGLSGLAPTTVINYHTRVIENVITEMVPSSLINNDLVSKFRAELKKGENEQRVIITTVSLLGGQKLEITAVTVFKSALKTALSNNQTISAPAYVTISPTIAFTTPNQKITKLKKSNHNTVSTATIKRTKISVPTATLKTYNTQIVKASLSIDGKGVLADETDGNNVGEKNGGDSLPTNSKNSAIYVNKSPTLKKPQKGQQIESDNKNRFPVAVNQLIGSLNFQRLTALKPVFNAMAGLLQTKFASALNPKNVSSHNQQKEQLQQSATSPLRGASFDTEIATDGMSLAKLDNSADYENRQQIESSTMKQQEKPIYIPIKDANFPVDNRRQQLIIRAVDYAAELLDTGSAQSLHIQPPKADVTISDDENSWLLQRTANDSLPQQLTIRQASPDYASQTQPKILNQKLHGESIPAGFEMSLINGGIPIRPGEVITANSDVIIGTPNGIQFPRMPVPKRNILTPSNPIQTNQNTPPANPLQQQSEAYRDKSPINTQMSSSFPHRNTYLYSHSQHRQHNQQNQNHAHKIKNLLKENYDSILRPPPVGLLKLSGQTVAPLSPPPLPSPTSTNSYTTLGTLSPPALTTSPSLITQYSSQTPALVETTNQVNAFTYENQNNKTVTSTHKPKINFVANYSKTSLFGEKIIGENRPPNLYDVMLYTPQQSADFYQKFWNTTQQENNGNTLLGQPNVAQHHQDRISTPEFSSNSYFTLSANYDMIRGVAPPLPEPNPIGSPSNHQNINLHNHVFSHNVNMHAPPLTFKKETDHPTHASAVHGQIPGNVGGTTQHLSFTIANMPHIKIPHNEKQVQISLTPQNIIGQITKPNTRTKHFASTSVETPPITYSGGNTASSTVIGSFTLDGNLNELLKTQQSPLKSNVPSPRIALKLQQKNYAQPYVKAHSNRVNVRDDVEDVSGFHRAIIPASSAIVTSSVQNIYRNYKPATPVQLTNGLPWPSLVSTHMNSDWPPYKLQASQYTSNSSAFSIPSSKIIKDNGAKNANPIVGDNNTPVIYYDQDNTINEAVSLSNSNEYENENVVAVAFANDDSDIIKPNDVHNVNGTNSNAVDLRVDPNTESATNILQRQFKTKQQQLKNLSRLHDTTEHNNNNKYVTPAQKWQENNIHQQSLYPFLLPNSTIEMNDLYSLQPTTYYVTSGTKESSFITSPTTTQTNVRHKLKSRPLHSPLLFRGVPFRVENSPTLEKQVKQQTTTQSVYIAKGEGFKRPGVGAEEALFSLEDEFSYNPARTSFIVNDKKHIHLETTMPPEMNNNYDNIASMLQTTSAPVPAKFITLQRLSSLSSSATQFLTIASTSKIANLNTITVESIQSAETSTYKPKQLFSEHNFDITAASENSNVYRKHISRVNQSILHHSNIRSQLTTAASMEQQISSSLRITPALGHKQLNVKSVVGLNPPPQKQPPHAVLLAPIKLEPLYTSDSSNNNTHVYNTISFKTMWQAPLQTLSETNGHEISSIPRSTDRRPLQQPKPIQMTYTLRNTTMLLGIIPKSAVTIITGDSKYYEDKLTNISTNIRNSSVWDISTSAISSIISITEKIVTSSSNQEFTKYANANTDKIPYNEIVKSSQLQYKEKIATYIEQEPQQNENIATVNGQHLKLNLKPLLESSESTSVETTNTMTSVSLSHTMHLPQDSSANQLNHVSLKKVSNQYKKQQIPTKYITRTEFLTVTTTRNTVILTSANERLQSKLFMVTRSKTATLVNSITHTEWTTETETDTTIAIATKTHTRTLVQPTKLIESYIILAPTTITKIETEIIAPGNGLIGEMGSTAIKAEGTESNTNIPYIINHNHKPSEFKKPQLNHEHFAYDVNSSIKYNKSNNNMYNEDISIIAQAIVKNDTSVDTTRIIPLEYGNKIAVSNESISNTTLPAINADKITPNNSIFIVLTNSQKGGKPKPPNDIADDLIGGSGNGVDTNPATIKLDYDDGWSVFNLPARVEESISLDHGSRKIKNQVLLGGVLIATPPKLLYDYSDTDAGTGADGTVTTCQPSCKMTRNEVCSLTDLQWRCVCRPGFARMFPDRSCKPTYTYTMHIQTDRIGNYKLLYDSTLDDNSTNHYKQLATFAKEAIDRMVMQSDFRDIYHGVKLTKFIPIEENYFPKDNTKYNQQGISANFLLQGVVGYIGYVEFTKGYRLYSRETNQINIARDVIFFENKDEAWKTAEKQNDDNCSVFEMILPGINTIVRKSSPNSATTEFKPAEIIVEESAEDVAESSTDEESDLDFEDAEDGNEKVIVLRSRRIVSKIQSSTHMLHAIIENPATLTEALKSSEAVHWRKAMELEHDTLMKNNTWELVEKPSNKNVIGCKWVFAVKRNQEGVVERYKARLVANGCAQKINVDITDTYAPVVRHSTVRILLALAAKYKLLVNHVDIAAAYLNGELTDEIYMKQPPMFGDKRNGDLVCRIKKSIYGLKQAGREWNKKVTDILLTMGCLRCKADTCVYIKRAGSNINLIGLYVDDMLLACSSEKYVTCGKSEKYMRTS